MTKLTVVWGVLKDKQEVLCTWDASEVPRKGETLKYKDKRYEIVEVEWSPPSGAFSTVQGAADATATLLVLSVP